MVSSAVHLQSPIAGLPHPLLVAALRNGLVHPLRVLLLLRALDPTGPGHLRRDRAVALLQAAGLARSTAYAWVAALLDGPFARAAVTKHGDEVIVFASYRDLAAVFDIARSGCDVCFGVVPLLGRAYRRTLLVAAAAPHHNGPLARATKVNLFGLSPSTQRRAERDAGAAAIANYRRDRAPDPTAGDGRPQPCRDAPGAFGVGPHVFEQLPNTTLVPREVVRVVRRRRHWADKWAGQPTGATPRRYRDRPPGRRGSGPCLWRPRPMRVDCAGGPDVLVRGPLVAWRDGRCPQLWEAVAAAPEPCGVCEMTPITVGGGRTGR